MSVLLIMDIMFVYDLSVNHMTHTDGSISHNEVVQSKPPC